MKDKIYLAADSGGTKTICVLLNGSGDIVAHYKTIGVAAATSGTLPVFDIINELASKINIPINGIYFSLGGPNVEEVSNVLTSIWNDIPICVEREANGNSILYAASFLDCKSVVMCGTGSVAVGDTEEGRKYAGGWGPIYGDGGSGGGIGASAIKKFLRSLDGMDDIGESNTLFSDITDGLNPKAFDERMEIKSRALGMSRRDIANLSIKIYEYVEKGDNVAKELYLEAANEIAMMADRVTDSDKVLLCGGFFKNKPMLLEYTKELFSKRNNAKMIYNDKFSPIIAAEASVLKNNGFEVHKDLFMKLLNNNMEV